ncbi:MAG: GAF domain-containing sensor histidine kinase [Candidatus Aceula meridiana]|nr:GAF domain-containing sensor histidine kinase [Candidatus Aceula meridiana]
MLSITSSIDTTIFTVIGIVILGAIGVLIFILINKIDQVRELKTALKKLKLSFDNLDEQAKLILKTDLELNRAQAELDKRLTSLDALQRTSRLISTTLDETEIFRRLDKSLMFELGFEKTIVLTFDKERNLKSRVNSGFSPETINSFAHQISRDSMFQSVFKEGHPLSSATATKAKKEKIISLLGMPNFILSPILTQEGTIGVIFFGNESQAEPISEADEEMASILTNQVGQSFENAQLFEQVYRSRQELELKIQERTKQLALALEKVQKASKTKSEFVSAVSHELRTPLTSIKGYAAILMSGKLGEIPPKVNERLSKINKHSDSLVELINDLLDISRIESGRIEMRHEKIPAKSLIENIADILMPQIKEKNIELLIDIPNDTPDIFADQKQMERVFINLLSNAIKYTPNGTIKITASRDKNKVLFEVEDNGTGIKEDDLPHLFDEFYRVENDLNQNIKGTGLGLSLVKNIIEAHSGEIWVTSELKVGTTFHFTFPSQPQENILKKENQKE